MKSINSKLIFYTFTFLCTSLSIFACSACSTKEQSRPERPNILILYADDLGYGDFASYNPDSKIPTPHLDRLAAEGMRFTDGHSSSGICTPSRYALLTGRYHWRKFHGIVGAFGESVFDADEFTLPEMLQGAGYTTAAIGKWHLGWDWSSVLKPDAEKVYYRNGSKFTYGPDAVDWSKPIADGPLAHGFDYYFGDTVINFPPYAWIENDRVIGTPTIMLNDASDHFEPPKEGTWEARPGPMMEGWDPYENIPTTTQRGVELIHELAQKEEPFFIYFAFPSPHAPIIPNDEFDGTSGAGPYGDLVVETDAACGRLLQALVDAGVEENTLVIFSADNGPEKYAYARDVKYDHWSSEPLRGLKRHIYEGGHRVPFIVKWPGVAEAGSVSHALVSQIDLMATLAAAVGVEVPAGQAVDSQSFLPALRDARSEARSSHVHNTFASGYAIRHGKWVLVDAKSGYDRDRPEQDEWEARLGYVDDQLPVELYDLSVDISQRNNVASQNLEVVAELKDLLSEIRSGESVSKD